MPPSTKSRGTGHYCDLPSYISHGLMLLSCGTFLSGGPSANNITQPEPPPLICLGVDATTKTRRPRSDGERNRDRLLLAATVAFKEAGPSDVTLESIARRAGVGIGTLYDGPIRRLRRRQARYGRYLRELAAAGTITSSDTRERLTTAIETLLAAGATSGALRDGPDPADVFAALTGIFLATEYVSDPSLTQRLLDLLMHGLQNPTRIIRSR